MECDTVMLVFVLRKADVSKFLENEHFKFLHLCTQIIFRSIACIECISQIESRYSHEICFLGRCTCGEAHSMTEETQFPHTNKLNRRNVKKKLNTSEKKISNQ